MISLGQVIRTFALVVVGGKQRAQDVVEYGLLIATVALIVLVATTAFGHVVLTWFETLAGRITTVGT